MDEFWGSILVAVSAGVVLIVTAFLGGFKELITIWFSKISKRMKRKTYAHSVERLAEFLEIFQSIQEIKAIQRCLVLHGKNCGGLPTPGKPYTVRAVHGWTTKTGKKDPFLLHNFDLQVDVHYIRLLEDVIKIGYSEQVFDLMPNDSKLKMLYEMEGVKYEQLHYLGLIDGELLFISASAYDQTEFDRSTHLQLQSAIDRMRATMNEE